jgi:ABC-type dipeptide/oligopeptide/nickel transport system permease component
MVKTKRKPAEADSAYILKLVLYLIVGSLWLKISRPTGGQVPIPIGFIVGVLFAMHENFRIDRKIEYALLLVAMFVGFWLPIGIFIAL